MHVIETTLVEETRLRHSEMTWQTRAVCSFIALTVQTEEASKHAQKMLAELSLVDLADAADADTGSAADERTLEDIMENGNVAAALEKNSKRSGPGLPFN